MPKQIHKIQEFHGGLNNSSDARDISDAELADIQDAVVSDLGKIRNMGGTTAHAAHEGEGYNPRPYVSIKAGYGLFAFSHDRTGAELGSGTAGAEQQTDYLALADADVHARIWIYNFTTDVWRAPVILGNTTGMRVVFYMVDGVLRVSDGNFGNNNANKWYGYINRILFKNISQPITINQWHLSNSKCERPPTSYFQNTVDFTTLYTDSNTQAVSAVPNVYQIGITRSVLASGTGGALANVGKAVVSFRLIVPEGANSNTRSCVMRCGTAAHVVGTLGALASTITWDQAGASSTGYDVREETTMSVANGPGTYDFEYTFYFDSTKTLTAEDWGGSTSTSTNEYLICEVVSTNSNTNRSMIWFNNITCHEVDTIVDLSTYLNPNNAYLSIDWNTGDGNGWSDGTTAGIYEYGISHIYDEKQESQIRTLGLNTNVSTTAVTAQAVDSDISPGYRLHIGMENGFNKRITGINLYMKDITTITEDWYLQAKFDLITGVATLDSNQQKYDVSYQFQGNENYYFWEIPSSDNNVPSKITTYQINSGFDEDELSVTSKYKTAVVVNRMVYIANVEIEYEPSISGAIQEREVKGDAMLKSPVNQFDNFPLSRVIEASIQDGDEIVKLEEYADRILQFKKKKMHLINVSQNLEFLEDTFMHKGIANPASAVKTDYGVAWVNENGVYLYDGQKVTDLLEKRGRQIIKESKWASFLGAAPVIGYLPNKRQLIILKTAGSEGLGNIYLFDMVTQSWTTGDSKFTDSARQTNFVVDANNNLVIAQRAITASYADMQYWDDAADASGTDTYKVHTKDIDFGQPGQRKKVYKAYISYKGDGRTVDIQYSVNGDNNTTAPFYRTTADGSSDKTNSDTTPLLSVGTDDWVLAELRPVTSINNVYSFKLQLGGTSPATFEINDMSIVYRLKNIK